jgi:hypothetical protein
MRILLTTLMTFGLFGFLRADDKPVEPPKTAAEFLRAPTVALLKGVNRVEVFRITPKVVIRRPVDPDFEGYRILAKGKDQGDKFATDLASILLTDATWINPQAAKCFEPGVAFRLWKDKARVDVLICFKCHNLQVTSYDSDGKQLVQAFGNMEASSEAALLKLAKAAFPDDKEIQDLGK